MKYILPLSDPNATLEEVGGKGASLARLSAAGFPVPGGFYITTSAYNHFISKSCLLEVIKEALEDVRLEEPATLEKASYRIREAFEQALIPPDIAYEVVEAYTGLSTDIPCLPREAQPGKHDTANPALVDSEHFPVAVRSSATAEDLPEASFAGQQETYLNVHSPESLLEAVKKCWSSLWTARAIAYRLRQKISSEAVSLAVVVQQLVPAEAAGILFTVDPVTGDRNRVTINASWGLGEAVVGGMVTPDTISVDKTSGAVIFRQTAEKKVMTVQTIDGTSEQPVAENLQGVPVLDDIEASKLVKLGTQVEELYNMPMDIEWALVDGHFHLLQARPITALPETDSQKPSEWTLPDPKGQYMRGSVVDILPDPLSPLFETLGLPAAMKGVIDVGRILTRSEPLLSDTYFTSINHYAYMNASLPPRSWWWAITGLIPAMPRILRKGHQFLQEEARPRYLAVIDKWQSESQEQLSAIELWKGINQILDGTMFYLGTMMFATMGASAGSEMLFTRVYDKLVKKEGDPPAPIFLMGYNSVPIQAEKSLYDLAVWIQDKQELCRYILSTSSDNIVANLKDSRTLPDVISNDWENFHEMFQKHLERFGYIIYNLDFSHPLSFDHPQPLLETIRMYLKGEGVNPHQRQHLSEEKRKQAVQASMGRIKGLRRWAFKKSLGWAQSLSEIRESALADIGLGYPLLRQMLKDLGQRLVKAGLIEKPEEIYWLNKEEIEKYLPLLEQGMKLTSQVEEIQQRRAYRKSLTHHTPPPILPPKDRIMGFKTDVFVAASEEDQLGSVLKGVPASSGRVIASACIIRSPEDFHRMKPGLILVASTTTPAWTPLFAMASAVVTDIGGPLSHGSIVAREYGIPAVMGTGVATRRIQNGQVITVDGDAGTILLGKA